MKKIILASASPRRKELIKTINDDIVCIPADVDETVNTLIPVDERAEHLACRKAKAVSDKNPDAVVIGCDTVVIIDGIILGKPKDKDDALRMLSLLSGKTHKVITGCAIMSSEKSISFSEVTEVTFYDLTSSEIADYIESSKPFDKAGSYGIQEKGGLFVKKIDGDYFNVVGLPLAKLNRYLKNF